MLSVISSICALADALSRATNCRTNSKSASVLVRSAEGPVDLYRSMMLLRCARMPDISASISAISLVTGFLASARVSFNLPLRVLASAKRFDSWALNVLMVSSLTARKRRIVFRYFSGSCWSCCLSSATRVCSSTFISWICLARMFASSPGVTFASCSFSLAFAIAAACSSCNSSLWITKSLSSSSLSCFSNLRDSLYCSNRSVDFFLSESKLLLINSLDSFASSACLMASSVPSWYFFLSSAIFSTAPSLISIISLRFDLAAAKGLCRWRINSSLNGSRSLWK